MNGQNGLKSLVFYLLHLLDINFNSM